MQKKIKLSGALLFDMLNFILYFAIFPILGIGFLAIVQLFLSKLKSNFLAIAFYALFIVYCLLEGGYNLFIYFIMKREFPFKFLETFFLHLVRFNIVWIVFAIIILVIIKKYNRWARNMRWAKNMQ